MHGHTHTHTHSGPNSSRALFQHASVSICLLCLDASVHFVDLFSASETIAVEIGKGINFMQMYANNCDTELHPHRFYANEVCKTGVLEGPTNPNPLTSHLPFSPLPSPTSSPFLSPTSIALHFFYHFPFCPPSVSPNPLSTLSLAWRAILPRPLTPVSPNRPTTSYPLSPPPVILLFIPPPLIRLRVCCMAVSGVRKH